MARYTKYTVDKRFRKIGFDISRSTEYYKLERLSSTDQSKKSFWHKPYSTDFVRSDTTQ